MTEKRTEQDVARPMIEYLRDMRWDVHQEVSFGGGGRRADIVAVQGMVLQVLEVKQALNLVVLEQALGWLEYAHYVSIVIPMGRRGKSPNGMCFARRVCQGFGIGIWMTTGETDNPCPVLSAKIHRRPPRVQSLRAMLCEETRTFAPAGSKGRHWTPFKRTMDEVHRALVRGPLTTRELMSQIRHHYSSDASARSALPKWLGDPSVAPDIEMVPGSQPAQWRLKNGKAAAGW